jgi:adenylate kinase
LRKLNSSVSCVFHLDISTLESIKRLNARSKTPDKRNYDIDADVIVRRLETYQYKTLPVLEYYEKQKNIYHIDAVGTQEEVFKRLTEKLELAFKLVR